MKKYSKLLLIAVLGALMMASCGTFEEYVLINDIEAPGTMPLPERHDLKIKKGDELQIVVTHKIPQITEMFNQKINSLEHGEKISSFKVNNNGYINFPFFDTLKVEGMTCSELEMDLKKRIENAGLAYDPTINVHITNFKVTVIGESGTGIYNFSDENVSIFDLVAEASLVTRGAGSSSNVNGAGSNIRRDKVLIIRENDSTMETAFVNLLKKDIFYSPYYYMQQNDIVYVYPSTTAIRRSNQLFDYWWTRVSILTSAASMITMFTALFKL